ncbi:hypothetical protein [Variovorax sp. dw_954]|uniref:hypothetical protein n=1 Tax=Variovorax sp. dw_954 TaxID=2720078 RepID=UPI001BD55C0E|nr:hypothetical protein [Variovorax sp. dw_954]
MMHAVISRQAFLQQPAHTRDLEPVVRDALVVSTVMLDGQHVVRSRYGDSTWMLAASASNGQRSRSSLRFDNIHSAFRRVCKDVMYRYLRRGRDGAARPVASTAIRMLECIRPFIVHLLALGIARLSEVTVLACSTYIQACREHRVGTGGGTSLTPGGLFLRFKALELLHEFSQHTDDPMRVHPWSEASATRLAGLTEAESFPRSGKTPLMPDAVFSTLFRGAWFLVENGQSLLDLRDALADIERANPSLPVATLASRKTKYLRSAGFAEGLEAFGAALVELRTGCYIVVASLSGCRNHELAFVQSGCWSKTIDTDDNTFWWLHSQSTKTGAGHTRWMIPQAAVVALKLMERWALPLQGLVAKELAERRARDPRDPEIAEAERHANALFLGEAKSQAIARTLSSQGMNCQLRRFAAKRGIEWDLTSHQFRRKFANYVAHSRFGDLRYLKGHFKHWSADMTLLYALNDHLEVDLFLEIDTELDTIKDNLVTRWLRPDECLAGGYGDGLVRWRQNRPVTLFRDHAHMVRSVAASTPIRSNGHAWCTADDSLCVGNDLEKTRCATCTNAVIDSSHATIYQGLCDHLDEVLACRDIGEAGLSRVRRDLDRCKSVLAGLGHTVGTAQ